MPGRAGAVPAAGSCRCSRGWTARVLPGRWRAHRFGPQEQAETDWAVRRHEEGAAAGGAFTGTVRAARAGMLAQAAAPAGTRAAMTGVALVVSRRPRR